jgi:hypothetical protein
MFIVILSNFGNTSRFFSAQNVVQYILDGTIQKTQTQLYKRILRKLGTGSKYKNMEVAESAAGLLIYKELDYSCIHGGKNVSSISSGQHPNTR